MLKQLLYSVAAALVIGFGSTGTASATPIISGDGTETCTPNGGAAGACVGIGVHPLWQPNNPDGSGAEWISYADTGFLGAVFQPTMGTTPAMFVVETFIAAERSTLVLDVWADDTARVLIDALEVFAANFTQDICADGAIGCEPGEEGMIAHTFTTTGLHTLTFEVFQVGTGTDATSNPFGLLYAGEIPEPAEVPEPATFCIMGLGLLVLRLLRHRKGA